MIREEALEERKEAMPAHKINPSSGPVASTAVTKQPATLSVTDKQKAWAKNSFSLSIVNAEEFAPHHYINKLRSHDLLIVQEDSGYNFKVFGKNGVHLFSASRSNSRHYVLSVYDVTGEEVITLSRDCCCMSCCGFCEDLKVYSPAENLIGEITESIGSCTSPRYHIVDATLPDSPLYKITAPYCTFSCICNDVDFPVYETRANTHDNPQIGMISKRWGGMFRELLTDIDTFGVNFPLDLDPKHKVLFLAACFFIDKKHFAGPCSETAIM